jgi:hypothetical protein
MQFDGRKWLFTANLTSGVGGGSKLGADKLSSRPGVSVISGGGGTWTFDATALVPAGATEQDVEVVVSLGPAGSPSPGWSYTRSMTGTPGSVTLQFFRIDTGVALDITATVTGYLRVPGQFGTP